MVGPPFRFMSGFCSPVFFYTEAGNPHFGLIGMGSLEVGAVD